MIEQLIPRAFAIRDMAHKAHWKTTSYAQHIALGDLYEEIIPALDVIVEAHQGMFGLIDPEPTKGGKETDMAAFLREEADWMETNRDLLSSGVGAIGNLLDNLTAVYLKAAYKLENLK